jgi:hypothetical protein
MGDVAVSDDRERSGREHEPGSTEDHDKKLRLVAEDLDDGLVP